jgi:hypothetical protein
MPPASTAYGIGNDKTGRIFDGEFQVVGGQTLSRQLQLCSAFLCNQPNIESSYALKPGIARKKQMLSA